MKRRTTALVATVLLGLAGCGGDGDDTPPAPASSSPGSETSSSPAADYKRAEAAMRRRGYDTAIPLMEGVGDYRDGPARVLEFRTRAAKETLAEARTKIARAPRAAVSLTETSLKYKSTPEAQAFLRRAQAALERFKKSAKDDQTF